MNKKKAWLDKLYYDIGKQKYDFRISMLKKLDNGNIISSKWFKYSEMCFGLDCREAEDYYLNNLMLNFSEINNREILPNEIVIDLEEKESLPFIMEKLKSFKVSFMVFDTFSRGVHVHMFFNVEIDNEKKKRAIKFFGGDELKVTGNAISLEYGVHWKSKKRKELIYDGTR